MSHIPGPWAVNYKEDASNELVITTAHRADFRPHKERRICAVSPVAHYEKEITQEDTANIIAAAPAMYEALKVLVSNMEAEYRDGNGDKEHDGIKQAKRALTQAEGK